MASLSEKKIKYAAIVAEFEEKRVSLEDWMNKYTLKEKLKAEIYEADTPLEQKIIDIMADIKNYEEDISRCNDELTAYINSSAHEDYDHINGGALLGPASAAPPFELTIQDEIKSKTFALEKKKAKLASLLDELPPVSDCSRHKPNENPAALCHTARGDGMYSMYAPNCNGCFQGVMGM